MSDLFSLGNKVTDSDEFIIYFSLLLNGLLQQLDAHLLLPQAHVDGQGLRLGLAPDLGDLV